MQTPDPELLLIYGNTKLAEEGDAALAARIAALVLSLGLVKADQTHVKHKREQKEQEDSNDREMEAERMQSTIEAMKHASVAGQLIARNTSVDDLSKLAFGAAFGSLAGSPVVKGLAAAGGALGKAVAKVPGAINTGVKSVGSALTPGWKTKALATGGVLGAGYLGYKGLSAMRDYASYPPPTQTWGARLPVQSNVNEYGTPTY